MRTNETVDLMLEHIEKFKECTNVTANEIHAWLLGWSACEQTYKLDGSVDKKLQELNKLKEPINFNLFKNKYQEIEKDFDWMKVWHMMSVLDWTWHDEGVPTVNQLIECAYRLFTNGFEHINNPDTIEDHITISGGGFHATTFLTYDEDILGLNLKFVLEEYDS